MPPPQGRNYRERELLIRKLRLDALASEKHASSQELPPPIEFDPSKEMDRLLADASHDPLPAPPMMWVDPAAEARDPGLANALAQIVEDRGQTRREMEQTRRENAAQAPNPYAPFARPDPTRASMPASTREALDVADFWETYNQADPARRIEMLGAVRQNSQAVEDGGR